MKKQVFNPFLPLDRCICDNEAHVFGDRVYVYGSHDKEGGDAFCMLGYEVWSVPLDDLSDWRCEGIVYRPEQDPDYGETYRHVYAPDVVRGNDGRYYLYYAMSGGGTFTGNFHVAVSDSPAGKFEYYGCVRNQDGTPFTENITFDPGLINDNGKIRLYYGWSLAVAREKLNDLDNEKLIAAQMMLFEKTREEVLAKPYGVMGAFTVELDEDMLTVKEPPKLIAPGQFSADGTSFKNHAFFEASSIRKIDNLYYFVYSSEVEHELCYATSRFPDRDFTFGGVIISNGDIGYRGNRTKVAATGNNHGSIEKIGDDWYIFYHRQTHGTSFSRQGCAEKIKIADGKIGQVEMTSCGLNGKPLSDIGMYPAPIACHLVCGVMPHIGPKHEAKAIPHITHEGNEHFITGIKNGTRIGYKFFYFGEKREVSVRLRGNAEGKTEIFADDEKVGEITISPSSEWKDFSTFISILGKRALFFNFIGTGECDFISFELK